MGIHAKPGAFLADGVLHHEALHRQGPPGIENGESPARSFSLQRQLSLEQTFHHGRSQPEGRGTHSIGGPEGGVGMGLEAQQPRRELHQGLGTVVDGNRTPGTQSHGGRAAPKGD